MWSFQKNCFYLNLNTFPLWIYSPHFGQNYCENFPYPKDDCEKNPQILNVQNEKNKFEPQEVEEMF